MFLLFS